MSQDEINDAEWRNPANWTNSSVGFYFSKRDTRLVVPKRIRALGWTLNMAHRGGPIWLIVLLTIPSVLIAAVVVYIFLHR
jgi:uncharacterized membrane protein